MHLNDEDLILHFYGEHDDEPRVAHHLSACAACRDQFARLRQVLALVDAQEVPEPAPAFERTVWARLEPELDAHRRGWLGHLLARPARWAWAGGVAALVIAAFAAGRLSHEVTPAPAATTASAPGEATERVLVIAVVDHLDRSQMMLVELINGELADPASLESGQERARDLVAANRLYRQSAAQTGDDATGDVLDDLERVLLEIANAPADASVSEIEALRARIESGGLLFRVRVVQSEMQERRRQTVTAGSTS